MLSNRLLVYALSAFGVAAAAVGSQSSQPGCVAKCWANSQYVSNCAGDQTCLCEDAVFQNALYQCLYSQCQTSQFSLALHHALEICSSDSVAPTTTQHVHRQGADLRKRGYGYQSNSVIYTRTTTRANPTTTEVIVETETVPCSESTATPSGYQSLTPSAKPSTYTYKTGTYSHSSHRGSQSVSASAYQTYTSSRANPTGAVVTVLTVTRTAVPVSGSVPAYTPVSSSVAPPEYTPSSSTTAAPVTPTPPVYTPSPSSLLSQSSDGQVVVTATVTGYVTPTPVSSSGATPVADVRAQWNSQRYPSDTGS